MVCRAHARHHKLNYGQRKRKRPVSISSNGLFKDLAKKKKRIETDIGRLEARSFCLDNGVKKIILLPMIVGSEMKWTLVLGFKKGKTISAEDLDLYDAFSIHAAAILNEIDELE